MNVSDCIAWHAQNVPDKTAVAFPGGRVTYSELDERINQTASALRQHGIRPGDRVLIQIGNAPEFIYSYFGIIRLGALVVPVNPMFTGSEIEGIASDCEPAAYIFDPLSAVNATAVASSSSSLRWTLSTTDFPTEVFTCDPLDEPATYDEDDVCEILYTSGTTGRPKGAMLTHQGLYSNAVAYKDALNSTSEDISLIVAPLYHSAAQTNCMNVMFVVGGTNFLLPRFHPELVLETLQDERITYFFGPPTMYTIMLNHPAIDQYTFNLRIAFTGSAPMAVDVHRRWKERFGFEILEGYGLTECSPVVTNHRPEGVKKLGSIGPAIDGVEVRIFDEHDNEVPIGQIGELVVRGPNVMKGYWRNPQATAEVMRNGWFHTGDIAYQDEDGYFYIVDRKKDMIIRGGMKIYPREVEEVLYQYPKVLEASVVGMPHDVLGEEVKAFVTLRNSDDTLDVEDVRTFCKQKLAPYKVPTLFEVIEDMPKTLSGKIKKTDLRANA
jgi:long-chain acyl-CoA synthetase